MNTRSPPPVRITARTLRSSLSCSKISVISDIIVALTALTGGLS